MKANFFLVITFFLMIAQYQNFAQGVAINSDNSNPDSSAILDVKSSNKGLLVPRVTQAQKDSIATPATGLLVYQTDNTSGFYCYNGAGWLRLSLQNETWSTTGNAGTNPETHFVGTTDNQPLHFKANNIWAGEIHPTSGNIFLGMGAGQANTSGQANTAIGEHSLFSNTEGFFNSANGYQALYSNTTGCENTASGYSTLFFNTGGNYNTASGYKALFSNTTASGNTAEGHQALYSNTSGSGNTAIGSLALFSNTTGSDNNAVGLGALINNTIGNTNTAIGTSALTANTTGNNNIAIGSNSGTAPGFTNLFNTIGLGNDGSYQHGASNQVVIGNSSMLVIAGKVGWSVLSDARIKNTIYEDVKGLDFILKLRPVTYHISNKAITAVTGSKETPDFPGKYDGEKVKYSGFIAQEVEQAAIASNYEFSGYDTPKNERGLYTIKYAEFVVPLVKGMQEQQQMIDELKKSNEDLNKTIEQLLIRIEKLETK